MPVYFNGRFLVQPQAASRIDESGLANTNVGVGKVLALLGVAKGGQPKKALRFTDPSRAIAVLRDGELLDAVLGAFSPSTQVPGASTIVAVRVNPAVKATGTLKDASGAVVVNLEHADWGIDGNRVRFKVENGTTKGKKLSVGYGDEVIVKDNVAHDILSIRYTGANATATLSITATELSVTAGAGESFTLDFASYPTVRALYDALASKPFLAVSLLTSNPDHPTAQALDFVTNQDIKTAAFVITAHLQAIIDWYNSGEQPYIRATRPANVGTLPANVDWTYLAGGSEGIPTIQDWQDAFDAIAAEDVQYVCPVTADAAIHAMADTHVHYMSANKKERRAVVGGALGERPVVGDVSQIKTRARNLNSDRTVLVAPGIWDFDRTGKRKLMPPYQLAARIAGMMAGTPYGESMTFKYVRAQGLEYEFLDSEIDELLLGGVCVVANVPGRGFRIVHGRTTWLVNQNYNRVEAATGDALDKVVRDVREALEAALVGVRTTTPLGTAVSVTDTTLRRKVEEGLLVGDAKNPPYRNIQASIDGDVIRVSFECSPIIPANYVLITAHATVFRSSQAA